VGQADRQCCVYGALEGLHDGGFRNFSASNVRAFYGDVGYRNDGSEFHLNMGVASNNFGAVATVPVRTSAELLGATYTNAADHSQPRRLRQPDRKSRGDADLDGRRFGACPRLPAEDGRWQSVRHPAMCRRSDPALF